MKHIRVLLLDVSVDQLQLCTHTLTTCQHFLRCCSLCLPHLVSEFRAKRLKVCLPGSCVHMSNTKKCVANVLQPQLHLYSNRYNRLYFCLYGSNFTNSIIETDIFYLQLQYLTEFPKNASSKIVFFFMHLNYVLIYTINVLWTVKRNTKQK